MNTSQVLKNLILKPMKSKFIHLLFFMFIFLGIGYTENCSHIEVWVIDAGKSFKTVREMGENGNGVYIFSNKDTKGRDVYKWWRPEGYIRCDYKVEKDLLSGEKEYTLNYYMKGDDTIKFLKFIRLFQNNKFETENPTISDDNIYYHFFFKNKSYKGSFSMIVYSDFKCEKWTELAYRYQKITE